jgi:glycosidase
MMKQSPNDTKLHSITKQEITLKSRDNARTPMQWDSSPHGGFTSATCSPWQRANESFSTINAASQIDTSDSVFKYWASILKLRKEHKDVFIYGDFKMLDAGNEDVFAYLRTWEAEQVIVVCNFRKEPTLWKISDGILLKQERLLTSNIGKVMVEDGVIQLRPFEAFSCYVT